MCEILAQSVLSNQKWSNGFWYTKKDVTSPDSEGCATCKINIGINFCNIEFNFSV